MANDPFQIIDEGIASIVQAKYGSGAANKIIDEGIASIVQSKFGSRSSPSGVTGLNFSAQIDDWVRKTQQRMDAVFKLSVQYLIDDVIARTPVDTGYLRASFTVTTNAPLPTRGKQGDGYLAPPYILVVNGARLGDVIHATFVANYAGFVEYGARGRAGVGMVRLAALAWPQHVNRAVAAAKARVAGTG